jgi:hypothetical protein
VATGSTSSAALSATRCSGASPSTTSTWTSPPTHGRTSVTEILDEVAETVWDTGIEFGTVSAMFHGLIVEITTFRADAYDGASTQSRGHLR